MQCRPAAGAPRSSGPQRERRQRDHRGPGRRRVVGPTHKVAILWPVVRGRCIDPDQPTRRRQEPHHAHQPRRQPDPRHALRQRRDARGVRRDARISSACWTSRPRWPACRPRSASSRPTPRRRSPRAARIENLRTEELAASARNVGYPVVGLVAGLSRAAGEAGGWTHWGATTQDIMDTATVLQVREGLALIAAELRAMLARWPAQADRHRHTVMAGRTHLQQALPVTFGLKCADLGACRSSPMCSGWTQLRPRVEQVEFAGAAGTLASLGDQGIAVMEGLAAELGLAAPAAPWHVCRDGLAETVGFPRPGLRQPGEDRHRHHPAGADRGGRGRGTLCRRARLSPRPCRRSATRSPANTSSPPRATVQALVPVMLGAMAAGPRARDRAMAGGDCWRCRRPSC